MTATAISWTSRRAKVEPIADYVRYKPNVDLVLVATYNTDSALTAKALARIFQNWRAESLREYFKSLGLPEDRIQVQGYGKKASSIADNRIPVLIGIKRRVVISLGRTQV